MATPHTSGAPVGRVRATRRRPGPATVLLLLIVVLTAVPLLASSVWLAPRWVPHGDEATIVLRGDDLFSRHTPLVGMPSTVGSAVGAQVHHPGPLESQLIGLVAAAVDDPRVPVVVVTLVNLASVLVALLWAHRLGGPRLLTGAAVVLTALLWSLRGQILVTPFNPHVAVLPCLACLASLVAATERRPWAVTAAVGFGSWAAQAHLTITGPVFAAAASAAFLAALRRVRAGRCGRSSPSAVPARRRLLVGAGVLLTFWAFPLTDALTNRGGNVRAMFRASGALEEETLGVRGALDLAVQALAVRPVWAQAGAGPLDLLAPPSGSQYATVGLLVAVALASAVACRVRRPVVTAAVVVAFSALTAGVALTARIPNAFFNLFALHNYLWLWPVVALLWLVVIAAPAHLLGSRPIHPIARTVGWASAGFVVAALAVGSLGAPHRAPGTAGPTYVRSVAPVVADALDPAARYLLDLDPDIATYNIGTGLLHHLERAGYDVRVRAQFAPAFGDHRVGDDEDRDVIIIRMGRDAPPAPAPAAVAIAAYRPPPALVEERAAAEQALVLEIQRRGGVTIGTGERIEPHEAEVWVRSGELLSALTFRLVDTSLAGSPAARTLGSLAHQPLHQVVVYLLPAD